MSNRLASDFDAWFVRATGGLTPFPYQCDLAEGDRCLGHDSGWRFLQRGDVRFRCAIRAGGIVAEGLFEPSSSAAARSVPAAKQRATGRGCEAARVREGLAARRICGPGPIHVSNCIVAGGMPKPTSRMAALGAVSFSERTAGKLFREADGWSLRVGAVGRRTKGRVVAGVGTTMGVR